MGKVIQLKQDDFSHGAVKVTGEGGARCNKNTFFAKTLIFNENGAKDFQLMDIRRVIRHNRL